jgi:hypothetical protein
MGNETMPTGRAPVAGNSWTNWDGCILPVRTKLLLDGEPRLVGLFYRLPGLTRAVVRLEWADGNIWVKEAKDCPWEIHILGEASSEMWADYFCERVLLEWCSDQQAAEIVRRIAA